MQLVTNKIWPMTWIILQKQKAHEALIKILQLQGSVDALKILPFSRIVLVCDLRKLCVSFVGIYRVAKEPRLDEWTRRAEICDTLQEPVGSLSSAFIFLSTLFFTTIVLFTIERSCH